MQNIYKIFNILSGKGKAQYLPIVDTIIVQVINEFLKVQLRALVLFPMGSISNNMREVIVYKLK